MNTSDTRGREQPATTYAKGSAADPSTRAEAANGPVVVNGLPNTALVRRLRVAMIGAPLVAGCAEVGAEGRWRLDGEAPLEITIELRADGEGSLIRSDGSLDEARRLRWAEHDERVLFVIWSVVPMGSCALCAIHQSCDISPDGEELICKPDRPYRVWIREE